TSALRGGSSNRSIDMKARNIQTPTKQVYMDNDVELYRARR
ncbi:MAG: hypothetical protein ACJA0W_003365, partial [Candidatus Azotimanducaceae bacterium]